MEKEFWMKYRDRGLAVFGVNVGERQDPERMARTFVERHRLTYPTLMDTQGVTSRPYRVEALPTVAVIDRKGVLRRLESGFDEEGIAAQVERLLAER